MNTLEDGKPIALALSGGGIRAMVFHLGVLQRFAELRLFEKVGRISTVSGGSLVVGLIFKEAETTWPSSSAYLENILPSLQKKLCGRSLQWGAARQLVWPTHWRFILTRSNMLGATLREDWGVSAQLSDLPNIPEWSINGTTAETGKRFRFKRDSLGDYTTGYAPAGEFSLADAMAVSAAFPGGFGPFRIDVQQYQWMRREWNAPVGSEEVVEMGTKPLHLYDGGVYDNLGLEPFFDAGVGTAKHVGSYIVVSDAGAPLPAGFGFGNLNPMRFKRMADIMSDQSRALRVRTFVNYLQKNPNHGAFLPINTITSENGVETRFASSFPTTLRKTSNQEFARLLEHGYRVTRFIEDRYGLFTSEVGISDSELS